MEDEDVEAFLKGNPPKSDEKHGDYTKRMVTALGLHLTTSGSTEKADRTQVHTVAGYTHFGKAKTAAAKPKAKSKKDELIEKRQEEQAALMKKPVNFSPNFNTHMYAGEKHAKGHKGLHALCLLLGVTDVTKRPAVTGITRCDSKNGCYSADIKLHGNADSKRSSLFPDNWTDKEIRPVVEAAFRYWRVHHVQMVNEKGPCKWAGMATVNGIETKIGGYGDGDKKEGLTQAYPAINGAWIEETV